MTAATAIAVRGICKRFEEHVALQDVSFTVPPAQFLCVLGPSGCGKTTLLRIIAGLVAPDEGEVRVHGEPVTRPRPDVGFVFQQFGLFPWKTAHDNIAFGLVLRGTPAPEVRRRVDELMRMMKLEGFERHYPYQLSGGMQQRIGIARALAVGPRVLLMDEPFGSLDAQTREVLQGELLSLWERSRQSVIFVTHSIDEAITLGDRILVMQSRPGRIVEDLAVDLPRPRDVNQVRHLDSFVALRDRIWQLLRQA